MLPITTPLRLACRDSRDARTDEPCVDMPRTHFELLCDQIDAIVANLDLENEHLRAERKSLLAELDRIAGEVT
jgi:hypothetical protein